MSLHERSENDVGACELLNDAVYVSNASEGLRKRALHSGKGAD